MYRPRIDRSAGLGRKGEGDVGCASLGSMESNNCISDLRGFVVMSRGMLYIIQQKCKFPSEKNRMLSLHFQLKTFTTTLFETRIF